MTLIAPSPSRYPANAKPFAHPLGRSETLALMGILVALGAWLRLDQWLDQGLIFDEWHALPQVIEHTPAELFLSFCYADYSIPLCSLHSWIAPQFGHAQA